MHEDPEANNKGPKVARCEDSVKDTSLLIILLIELLIILLLFVIFINIILANKTNTTVLFKLV